MNFKTAAFWALTAIGIVSCVAGCTAAPENPASQSASLASAASPQSQEPSSDSSQQPSGPPSQPAEASASVPPVTDSPAVSQIAADALTDVACQPDAAGVWSFSGQLHNRSAQSVNFTVAIAVGSTSSVLGHSIVEQTVPAGGSVRIESKAFATGTPAGAMCQAVASK